MMNKPLMGHGEEENPICIRCMHTQSLVGHMQVDNTVLQAGGNVDWRKKAVSFFAHSFQQVMLRDDCFVAMLALMDRMTVLSTREATPVGLCGTSPSRTQEEVLSRTITSTGSGSCRGDCSFNS